MDCTACKKGTLIPDFIEGQFRSHICSSCQGQWILIEDYLYWQERNPEFTFHNQVCVEELDIQDSKLAMLCPLTGTIMRKFKISSKCEHKIDYSSMVGGIWLDKGEWELLKQADLAGSLNMIITRNWQQRIRKEVTKESFSDIYESKFGKETYSKIKLFREWMNSQDNKADLRAYILAQDPYSADK